MLSSRKVLIISTVKLPLNGHTSNLAAIKMENF